MKYVFIINDWQNGARIITASVLQKDIITNLQGRMSGKIKSKVVEEFVESAMVQNNGKSMKGMEYVSMVDEYSEFLAHYFTSNIYDWYDLMKTYSATVHGAVEKK